MTAYAFTLTSVALVWALLAFGFYRFLPSKLGFVLGIAATLILGQGALGASGWIAEPSGFPRFMAIPIFITVSLVLFAKSSLSTAMAKGFPLWFVIGFQSFRFLPETLLHLSHAEGLAPVQMTWHSMNFDVISACLGVLLGLLALRMPQRAHMCGWIMSVVGIGLLITIVSIAMLSAPTPLRTFTNEPANTFVAHFPYIYLPGIHVLIAAAFHVVLIKQLLSRNRDAEDL